MKDSKTVRWLYGKSKKQLIPMILLIVSNALWAVCGVLFALAVRGVIDGASTGGFPVLIRQATLLFGVILLRLGMRMVCRNLEVRILSRIEIELRTGILNTLMKKNYASVAAYHSGELVNRMFSDVSIISNGMTTMLPSLVEMLTRMIAAFCVLCALELKFAVVFVVGGAVMLIVTRFFRKLIKKLHKRVQETEGKSRSFLQEAVENLLVVKVFGVEQTMEHKAIELQNQNYQAQIKRNTISIFANGAFGFLFQMGYLYALVWSAAGVALNTITFGTLTAILQLVGQIQNPISGLSGLMPRFYGVIASAERLIDIEQLPDEAEYNQSQKDVPSLYDDFVSIQASGISFGYGRDTVLETCSLSIEKGDFAVIAGISGIGKSTLLKLMLGVYTAQHGTLSLILKENRAISLDRHTRKLFAYVPQGNMLFSGTIRENICFINPCADDTQVEQAVQISCCGDFIGDLPEGLHTVIGEKGYGLSEGQVQRLAIARALVSQAPVLLFDEATSALDEETERRVLQGVKHLRNKTCVIISHKQAAFAVCNKEIRIENKKIMVRKIQEA